ncbi:hypothetical protein ADUPG1_004048, partial [Aduncisulcus paluster]
EESPKRRVIEAQKAAKEDLDSMETVIFEKEEYRSKRSGRLYVPCDRTLRKDLMSMAHSGRLGGHKGRDAVVRTLHDWDLTWVGMRDDVADFISSCLICQRDRLSLDSFRSD